MMKVALCTFGFPEFTISLARSLERFCEPVVVMPEHTRAAAGDFQQVATIPYHLTNASLSKLRACSQMASIVSQFKPDVVHFQGWSPLLTPFLPIFKRFPIVYSWHDPVAHAGDESWAMDVTQKILVKAADRIVVLCDAMGTLAQSIHPAISEKLRVVHHGIFNCYVDGPEERPSPLDPDDKFILFFGRVAPYKGVEDLCQAFTAMRDHPEYKLVIAGKHIYPVSTPRELGSRLVVLNERISNNQLRYLFRHCALVVLPYRDATQSGVLMLAYAFGRPVLCTRVGGVTEMVEQGVTGLTVPPANPRSLAEALEQALKKPEHLETIGRQGLEFATQNFNWDKISHDTLSVYREAIAHKGLANGHVLS
jgi:alpha-maltose-1-phosphate synthase